MRPPDHQELLRRLLRDTDVTVRTAALNSVGPLDGALADAVVAGVDEPTTLQAALNASRRLGPPALALAADRLVAPGPVQPRLSRLFGSVDVTASDAAAILGPLAGHPNRTISIAALAALARHGATVEAQVLDRLLEDDAELTACALAAATSMTEQDDAVLRSLDDLRTLLRDRVLAVLAVRYGEERIASARRALASPDGARRALGVEMLLVSITHADATLVDPVVRDDLEPAERLRRLRTATDVLERDRSAWLADIVLDHEHRWTSTWMQAVALHAELASNVNTAARHARGIHITSQIPATPAHRALAEVALVATATADAESPE